MNVKGCGPGWLIARAVVVTLVGCPVGWSAMVADPASRSGVWEATETIDGATVHFRLNVTIRTNAQRPDGTFEFENRGCLENTLRLFEQSSADFSDCLIVAKNAAAGCRSTLTFDAECIKLPTAQAV